MASKRENGICIFGASSNDVGEEYFKAAYEVGRLIGLSGRPMVFGAGDRGLMGAAARGCAEAGGSVIGVIPEKLNKRGIYFEGCSERIETATMHERKANMEALSGAFIVLPGGFGTVDEFMCVLTQKQLGYFDKPIALLNTNGYYNELIRQIENCVERGFASPASLELFTVCAEPEEAVALCAAAPGEAR